VTAVSGGFFVFPATVGVLADVYSIEEAMFLQLVLVVGLLVLTLAGRRYVANNPV